MIIVGNSFEELRKLEPNSVQSIVTSPPYYGLRDYGIAGQIGQEDSPIRYIENLALLFDCAKNALKDNGTLWVNIGDTYFNKELIGLPWRFAFAMQDWGWRLRQDIIWHKTNPLPEPVKDRCVKAHEYLFLFSKGKQYYFDYEAIRVRDKGCVSRPTFGSNKYGKDDKEENRYKSGKAYESTGWANRRSVWSTAVSCSSESHSAPFPKELIRPCILAGTDYGDTVLDPFLGSGTTGQVCIEEGRSWIGIELNPSYAKIAERNTAQKGLL